MAGVFSGPAIHSRYNVKLLTVTWRYEIVSALTPPPKLSAIPPHSIPNNDGTFTPKIPKYTYICPR